MTAPSASPIVLTDTSGSMSPVVTPDRAALIFEEYLTYDAKNVQSMYTFVHNYPWVLQNPLVCTHVVERPCCYNTLKQTGWWPMVLANVPDHNALVQRWVKHKHVPALAYEASPTQLADIVDWSTWEDLVQNDASSIKLLPGNPDAFYTKRASVVLANRLGVEMAPLMCAALFLALPLDDMNATVGPTWTPLQKAQYAWVLSKTEPLGDIYPTFGDMREQLAQAQNDIVSAWLGLVPSKELAPLQIMHDMHNGCLDDTMFEMIQWAQFKPSTESLDYTVGLEEGPQ